MTPLCPACEVGDLSLCWNFQAPPDRTGHPLRDVEGCERRLRDADARARLDAVPGARLDPRRDRGVRRSVRGVAARGHPPRAARSGTVLVYGAGALGSSRGRDPARAVPGRRGRCGRPLRRAGRRWRARSARRECSRTSHSPALIEDSRRRGRAACCTAHHELPMAYPGGIDVVYDTISRRRSLEVACRVLKARGTIVKAGVHGPTQWEWTPLYFKEIALGRLERVRHRGRSTACAGTASRTTSISCERGRDRSPADAHAPVRARRLARRVRRARRSGIVRRDQSRAATLTRIDVRGGQRPRTLSRPSGEVSGSPAIGPGSALATSASRTSAGVASGWVEMYSAAAPATNGVAKLVPSENAY